MSSKENYFSTKKYGRFNCIYFLGFKLYCFTLSLSLSLRYVTVIFYASKFE